MASTIILSDNGASSGSAGVKTTGGNDGKLLLQTTTSGGTATTALTIDTSQNVGIGTSSPLTRLNSYSSTGSQFVANGYSTVGAAARTGSGSARLGDNATYSLLLDYYDTGSTTATIRNTYGSTDAGAVLQIQAGYLTFGTGTSYTERARIDSSGNLLVGRTSALSGYGNSPLQVEQTASNQGFVLTNSNAAPVGAYFKYTAAAPNSSVAEFLYCADSSALRMSIKSNGGISNYSANNTNLSDERTKTDIQDAGGYLSKICAIPVRTFKYKDQTDDLLNLGVIAQEVEAVAPELVDVSGFGETPEDGVPLKSIYQTDLQYALMKCIQEQQAIITTLTERITALEAK